MGSLVVGTSFAKGLALALNKPLIGVHHMKAHILSHFITHEGMTAPSFPYLCLTVSGGHTQIVVVHDALHMEIIGKTIDDAAGEAFDKAAKMLGLPYPGGPLIDQYGHNGNPMAFTFAEPNIPELNFSFSGLKTSILYFLQKEVAKDPDFIALNLTDLCASIQHSITEILLKKLKKAQRQTGITCIAVSGGVSVNRGLRAKLQAWQASNPKLSMHVAHPSYCTDNAAMVAITGAFLFEAGITHDQQISANAKLPW
jgi:N6-L-threonylcarbamoyladenine synthase